MTEPHAVATDAEEVAPDLWHWSVEDDRIGSPTHAHAVREGAGVVLVDPLPLDRDVLAALGQVEAICLTAACHQRSAWRLRRELGVPVHAPEGAATLEERPDAAYGESDELPGGLRAVRTPGPEEAHYALLRAGPPGYLLCADLLMRDGFGELAFVPGQFHDDPGETRRSVERLLELDFAVLCLDHGDPVTDDPHAAIRRLLQMVGR